MKCLDLFQLYSSGSQHVGCTVAMGKEETNSVVIERLFYHFHFKKWNVKCSGTRKLAIPVLLWPEGFNRHTSCTKAEHPLICFVLHNWEPLLSFWLSTSPKANRWSVTLKRESVHCFCINKFIMSLKWHLGKKQKQWEHEAQQWQSSAIFEEVHAVLRVRYIHLMLWHPF